MLSAEECRRRARECVELAQGAREPTRAMLLKLAANWLTLADGATSYSFNQSSPENADQSSNQIAKRDDGEGSSETPHG
jgi:hypothetical protein